MMKQMKQIRLVLATLAVAVVVTGCGFEHQKNVLAPSDTPAARHRRAPAANTSGPSMVGVWTSRVFTPPSSSTCSNFQWHVTSQTATSLQGDFTADCAAGLSISGSASGSARQQHDGAHHSERHGDHAGTSELQLLAHRDGHHRRTTTTRCSSRISGTTCLGPVHGTEVLRRKVASAPAPPASAPAPEAPPAPAPAPAPVNNDAIDLHSTIVLNSPSDVRTGPRPRGSR